MNVFTAGGKGLAVSRRKCRGSIPRDTATGKGCRPLSRPPRAPCCMRGEVRVPVSRGAAPRPWHKEGDTVVMPWIALGLQALFGEALLGTSNGASSHAQDRLLGSPKDTHSLLYLEVNPILPSGSPCPGVRCGAWHLLTSPAQQRGLSPPTPLLLRWLLPRRDLGGSPQSLRCLFPGVCPQASWQDGMALLGAAPLPPDNR